jgi:hypothetical protein
MAFGLSEEQKQRIEQEERVRLAEEKYRGEVRERLKTEPPEPTRPGSSKRQLMILIIMLVIGYVLIKSHQ